MQKEEYVYYPSKGKLILLFLGSLVFVCAGIFLFILGIISGEWIFCLIGGASILFFGTTMIYFLFRLFRKKPSLIIADDYLYDNGAMSAVGKIDWEEVEEVFVYEFMGQKFLGIEVKDPAKVMNRVGVIKKLVIKANKSFATVNIPQNTVNVPLEDLLEIIAEKLNQYEMRKKQA